VWRAHLRAGGAAAPETVVVKTAVTSGGAGYDPDAADTGPAWRLFNEWASLDLLARLAPENPLAPRLYGGDRAAGVIVVEDLRGGVGLDRILLGSDRGAAEQALVGYAEALGRMHAVTVGHEREYTAHRTSLGPLPDVPVSTAAEAALDAQGLIAACRGAASAVGIRLDGAAERDLEAVAAFWAGTSPARALVHSDACPDNCLRTAAGTRLVDFEFGGFRHPLVDGACLRLGFPSCWCAGALPDDVLRRAEAAYREALARGCLWAADDAAFTRALVDARAYWTVAMLAWAVPDLLNEDVGWGLVGGRQRVLHRLGLFAGLSEDYGRLRALGGTARTMQQSLAARWPDAAIPLAVFPAFS
jgi:hypothetical protein